MSRSPDDLGRAGPYRLLSLIEERGLLATFLAEHQELGRRALVRTLAPNVSHTPRLDEALEREARIVAQMKHEGIITLYEIVRFDGRVAVAFEHPDGPTLAEVQKALRARGGMTLDEALSVTLALARAVAHVHDRGFVHANVSLRSVNVSLGRGLLLSGFDRARETTHGAEIERGGLDPAYLSPEELMDEPPTTASDVFSLGVVAYELLSGKHPFGTSVTSDVALRVRTERPAPFDPVRRLPADIERAVLRAMSKQPNLRQTDAGELVRDLEGAMPGALPIGETVAAFMGRSSLDRKGTTGPAPQSRTKAAANEPRAFDLTPRLAAIFVAMAVFAVSLELFERAGRPASSAAATSSAPGYVRVLAHPWAEIWIDGAAVDTTPLARAIPLSPGRHTLVFKHPRAADERRVVDVTSGQVSTTDVEMRIIAPPVDAGVDASP